MSFDLIYARPGQTPNGWQAELARALSFGTGHLSLYQLTIEPGTRFATMVRQRQFFPLDDDSAADLNLLEATTYHDLQASWNSDAWMRGLRVVLGVNNLTGEDPPICLSCSLNGYDAATYDLPGRFFYARVGVKF